MKTMPADPTPAPREAAYYDRQADGTVVCRVCPHECRIGEGHHGRCRSRVNHDGRLWTEAYARVCALQVDPVEKKPLLHFLPGSRCLSLAAAGCNLSCLNCQNASISQASPADVPSRELPPNAVARLAVQTGSLLTAYTYTEPLTWPEYVRDCACACHATGVRNVLVTAGYINPRPLADLLLHIDAANVDLKSFSDATYRSVSRARLTPVLDALEQMHASGVWVEVTNLVIPGLNDSPTMLHALCTWLASHGFADRPLHFSRFFPQHRMRHLPPTPVETLLRARSIAWECGLNYVYLGNVSMPGAEDTCCPHCGRLLLRRTGYLTEPSPGFDGKCPVCGEPIAGVWK